MEGCHIHQKVAGPIPGQGTYLGCRFSTWGIYGRQLIDVSHIRVSLSVYLAPPSSPSKINKCIFKKLKNKIKQVLQCYSFAQNPGMAPHHIYGESTSSQVPPCSALLLVSLTPPHPTPAIPFAHSTSATGPLLFPCTACSVRDSAAQGSV